MINVCSKCGMYRADKIIDTAGPYAICPECGHKQPFLQLPLFVISGASGTGKTTICQELLRRQEEAVFLDSDIIWRPEFNKPETKYNEFFETWLRICKNISQSGRPVVLFGAGVGVPDNLETCIERRYFSTIHYLALVCTDEILSERLQQRPAWRGTNNPEFIKEQQRFNHWFLEYQGMPAIRLLDTSNFTVTGTAGKVAEWIAENIKTRGIQ